MGHNHKRPAHLTRRAVALGGGGTLIGLLLASRLYHLQFMQGDRYRTMAEGNRIKIHLTPPLRGILADKNGTPIATNNQSYRLLLRPDETQNLASTVEEINMIVDLGPEKVDYILKTYKPRRFAPPILLKEHLTWDEVASIEYHSATIPGVLIEVGQVRYYPFGEAFAHVLGYVGSVSEDDLDDQDLLKLPDFKVGKSGAERVLEQRLRGKPGVKEVEVNVHGMAVRELNTHMSTPGEDIRLTLDARLQRYSHELLSKESAACVVMDVTNGDILSLVSAPAYDPNQFSKGISSRYWKELNENKKVPLLNKALGGQYPPGSTFKMVVGLAGLQSGAVSANDKIYCPGHYILGNHRFNCWKEGGHGHMNLHNAIVQSCDTYFYTIANRMGIETIADMARHFGLGEYYDLALTGQRTGLVPTPEWKRKSYGQSWQGGDTINASIGQGYVLATPLQLAVMTARLANGGKQVVPRLVLPKTEGNPPDFPQIEGVSPYMDIIHNAMAAATNTQRGTAYSRRITVPEYAMAGKTGTSQVRRILQRGQDQSTLPWEHRHHAWFVAYAPTYQPRYACALIVEHGGGGGEAAAPHVRDILLKAQLLASENGKAGGAA